MELVAEMKNLEGHILNNVISRGVLLELYLDNSPEPNIGVFSNFWGINTAKCQKVLNRAISSFEIYSHNNILLLSINNVIIAYTESDEIFISKENMIIF